MENDKYLIGIFYQFNNGKATGCCSKRQFFL